MSYTDTHMKRRQRIAALVDDAPRSRVVNRRGVPPSRGRSGTQGDIESEGTTDLNWSSSGLSSDGHPVTPQLSRVGG